ncbi:MAG: signal peptidase I [Chloroflexia bacterium]|nr:signal peptidase I [Chloroflexia bacterium]
MQRTEGVTSGNAADDGSGRDGWLLGHFLAGEDMARATADVEVKWAVYAGGERRIAWGVNDRAHTLAILVRGIFRLRFPEREVLLSREGDYVLWEPGVPHLWQAEGPTIVVTVRWPSLPGDSRTVG